MDTRNKCSHRASRPLHAARGTSISLHIYNQYNQYNQYIRPTVIYCPSLTHKANMEHPVFYTPCRGGVDPADYRNFALAPRLPTLPSSPRHATAITTACLGKGNENMLSWMHQVRLTCFGLHLRAAYNHGFPTTTLHQRLPPVRSCPPFLFIFFSFFHSRLSTRWSVT